MATYLQKGISGTQFDAARVILGGDWRIPTLAEWEELISNCTHNRDLTSYSTTMELIGPNGNKIYFGCPGNRHNGTVEQKGEVGYFFSDATIEQQRYTIYVFSRWNNNISYRNVLRFEYAMSIRPVSMTQGVDLGLPSGTRWAEFDLSTDGFASTLIGDDVYRYGEIEGNKTDTYMSCYVDGGLTQAELGTSKDPLAMEWEDFDNPLVNRLDYQGLRQYHQKVKQAIDDVRKAMPAPTIVDTELDDQSENAIANKAVAKKIAELPKTINKVAPDENGNIDVPKITDDELQKTYIDVKNISGTKFDTARKILGGDWRLPTRTELIELKDNCTIEPLENAALRLTSKINGASIILQGNVEWDVNVLMSGTIMSIHDVYGMWFFRSGSMSVGTQNRGSQNGKIRPVSMVLGVDLGLPSGVRWSESYLTDTGFAETPYVHFWRWEFGVVEYGAKYPVTWDEMGTSADPLMGYYEELEETDHYLNTRGLNIVRKQINDKIGTEVSSAVKALGVKNVRWADESKEELIIELNS